ncbi:hypothetical protein D3C87_224220 [compost metagenome]
MIPAFSTSHVLPPYGGDDPAERYLSSPYETTLSEIYERFGHTPERIELIKGLISYRRALREVGITTGYQLIDGSFTENCESHRGRPPSDVDLITFAYLPVHGPERSPFVNAHRNLFDQGLTKAAFRCDAYFVDLSKEPRLVVEDTCYWYGLFSHQRDTFLWKGMLSIPLMSDDDEVWRILQGMHVALPAANDDAVEADPIVAAADIQIEANRGDANA